MARRHPNRSQKICSIQQTKKGSGTMVAKKKTAKKAATAPKTVSAPEPDAAPDAAERSVTRGKHETPARSVYR